MSNEQRLAGKVALVTGGSRGIGEAIVRRLAKDGADVACTYRSGKDEVQVIAADLAALGRRALVTEAGLAALGRRALVTEADLAALGRQALVIEADLADAEAPPSVVAAAVGGLGRLDVVVNNAAVTSFGRIEMVSIETVGAKAFDRLVAVDARAPFLLLGAAVGALADGGRVITISSALTSTALAGLSLYSTAKAFVEQLTKVAAVELAPRRITVNAVAPGTTAAGRLSNPSPEQRDQWGAAFSLGRIGEPDDTAAVVAFLASDDAGFITGQVITNNGGQLGPVGRAA